MRLTKRMVNNMKVAYWSVNGEDCLMIVPETEFETDFISKWQGNKLEAFVKTGLQLTDIVGIKIKRIIDDKDRK